ncbi:Hypothetical predicted protein [Octopus vulgaris]|uniref:Uncharacterized protein n=1 Tax=Octopus vulgaris TaxID=6645 RepID=A0AA36AVT4_OCTVU|nr:Hypothetical predicted protein [Octopus vulgaris]
MLSSAAGCSSVRLVDDGEDEEPMCPTLSTVVTDEDATEDVEMDDDDDGTTATPAVANDDDEFDDEFDDGEAGDDDGMKWVCERYAVGTAAVTSL